ncbi:LCP family protein [Candidatus Woesebacteria bacterium]|nr:LCP family protein [Candidatus Woesebacteria bacterium]
MTHWFRRIVASVVQGTLVSVFIGTSVLLFLLAFLTGWIVQRSVVLHDAFLETAGRSPLTIAAEAGTGWWQTIRQEETEPFRLLLLGIDEVAGSGRSAILTDTLMMITYQPAENTVSTLSIPRDVYHPEYATKVNALYFYGTERNPAAPEKFTSQVLTEMTGVDFDGVVVVSLEDVQDLIDLVGGVTVGVCRTHLRTIGSPRSGVDVSVET